MEGKVSESSEAGSGKTRKRPAAKAVTGQSAPKIKATIHLSSEADERLSIHAIKMGMDRSELVEWLISQYLRRWVVSDRGGPDGAAGGDAAA
jgi:Ribbon-helix-helix protein, copG family